MPANDQIWRPLSTLHKVFAASAVALLVATWLMMAKDHRDEWREYQRTADELKAAQLSNQLSEIQSGEYEQRLTELQQQRRAAEQELSESRSDIAQKRSRVSEIQGDLDLLTRQTKFKGAERDVARAEYDIAVRDQRPDAVLQARKADFDSLQQSFDEMSLQVEEKTRLLSEARADLAESTKSADEIDAELKSLRTESDRLSEALATIAPGRDQPLQRFKRWLMLQPIVDGFNSPHGIRQEWLPDLPITLGMTSTARFDRCRTCHVNIADFGAGNVPGFPHGEFADGSYPHPFSAHPNPDVYVTATSPHPMTTFGCTVCHDGDGSGTSFQNAEHTPNNPAQAAKWHEEFGWHSNHFWEYPMQPDRFIESSCVKCHHSMVELGINEQYGATAPKVFEGYEIVKEYGCFGCHEINGYDGARPIGPDLRLEPQTQEELAKYEADPNQIAGRERKVGPSLRHIAAKTTPEFVAYWTELPQRFRPDTKMPQFFHLSNQQDEQAERFQPVQLAAIAAFLDAKSQPIELMQPRDGYEPNAERGKSAFAERGCLACHSHGDQMFTGSNADFGPDLTRVHEKIKPGEEGFHWLYTWVKDPTRHSARTKMPDLYLAPEGEGENYIDPAADIAAFLLQGGTTEFPALAPDPQVIDELFALFARKSLTQANYDRMIAERAYPGDPAAIKGDEIELARQEGDEGTISEEEWERRKLLYVGRRTVSFYGCYGCHDIPGFEEARPIGTALQDWGRKDTSKLAFEHIEEFLHHHGGGHPAPAGESTHGEGAHAEHGPSVPEIAAAAVRREFHDGNADEEALSTAFFYENLQHHGRPGFIWQKLRQPRSYDYRKIETKGYDERLRMPQFPFTQEQIEAVTTFVLGLVAEPPPSQYVFQPDRRKADIIEGERLLDKYNCGGCHMLDLPEIAFATNVDELMGSELGPADYEQALDLLLALKPPRDGLRRTPTGEPVTTNEGENIVEFKGLVFAEPDLEEDPEYQEYSYDLWETLEVGDQLLHPASKLLVPAAKMIDRKPARGGDFAEWLVEHLMGTKTGGNRFLAWQASPPPLYKEGDKVQTQWLFEFLKNPDRLRYTTVLRMPRFNMSDDEAQALANYFAAVDGASYPYQPIPQQQPPYLNQQQAEFASEFPDDGHGYLTESWNLLNAPLCMKCHSVGGNVYTSTDPAQDIRGPDLDRVARRLRPDWTLLWLYRPAWITPYTSMPTVFPRNQTQLPELFGGDGQKQTIATRDALMNYYRLMEAHGPVAYTPEGADQNAEQNAEAPQTGAGGE
jgi:cytochrome c551/c552